MSAKENAKEKPESHYGYVSLLEAPNMKGENDDGSVLSSCYCNCDDSCYVTGVTDGPFSNRWA